MYVRFKVDSSDEWQVLFMGSADLGSSIVYVYNVLGSGLHCLCTFLNVFDEGA